jgi:hypothetical protein
MTRLISFNAALVVYTAFSTVIAYSLPESYAASRLFSGFADLMSAAFPAVDGMSAASALPHVTRVYYSLQWALVVPLFFLLSTRTRLFVRPIKGSAPSVVAASMVMGVLCLLLAYLFGFKDSFSLPASVDRGTMLFRAVISTRLGMGVLGSTCFLVMTMSLLLAVRGLRFTFFGESK